MKVAVEIFQKVTLYLLLMLHNSVLPWQWQLTLNLHSFVRIYLSLSCVYPEKC